MTPKQRELCRHLVITPPRGVSQIAKEEFLELFPLSVEQGKVALSLLQDAYRTQDAEDLKCVLIVGAAFGFGPEHADVLCRLVEADWHFSHEDVVSALGELRTPAAMGALFHATQWIPGYLDFDESRALASKAIWALGKMSGGEAEEKLKVLTRSDDPNLQEKATEQLRRRHKTS